MTKNARKPNATFNAKGKKPKPDKPLLTLDQWLDLLGYFLLLVALVSVLAVLSPNKSGLLGGVLNTYSTLFGLGQYVAPLLMGFAGFYLVVRKFGDKFPRLHPSTLFGVFLAFVCLLVTLHAVGTITQNGDELANAGGGGGSIGWGILKGLDGAVGNFGSALFTLIGWLVSFLLMSNVSVAQMIVIVRQRLIDTTVHVADRTLRSANNPTYINPNNHTITPAWDKEKEWTDNHIKINLSGAAKKRTEPNAPDDDVDDDTDVQVQVDAQPPARMIGAKGKTTGAIPVAVAPNKPLNTNLVSDADERMMVINTGASRKNAGANGNVSLKDKLPPSRTIGEGSEEPATPQPAAAPATQVSSRYAVDRDWKLPKIEDVLDPGKDATSQESDIRKRAKIIEETLDSFGVPGRITEVNRGPTITQFGVEPGFVSMKSGKQVKVKVSRIASLADDLALALAAPRIRIEAPVPGRNIVGIEVPNGETALVSLRDVMESEEFDNLQRKGKLRLGLGQDVSGHPVCVDLTSMPHMLIAGTTGSGKSVCVNSIINALLCYNTPQDLRFIMVDPKRVELTGYNGIPHLIAPVVVDVEKVTGVLSWVVREMDQRYRTFAKYGSRNIVDFNGKAAESDGKDHDLKKLPYIVVIVDELADLMMLAPDETEKTIVRLAQMARATGIHLIIATQRPSVDVVTGLIKANFPARIAFTVATGIDSRVILDSPGAEKLLGRGDMLVVMPDQPMPQRAQGCFLSDKEITKVVRHWRAQLGDVDVAVQQATPDPISASMNAPSVPMQGSLNSDLKAAAMLPAVDPFAAPANTWDEARALKTAAEDDGGGDKLFNDAVATVRMNGKASISLLQRRLRIGYSRAARMIEEMEQKNIVGPQTPGSQFREVLNSSLTPPSGMDD